VTMAGRRPAHITAHIEVSGTVQGVGFRPFVYRLAGSLGLDGTVRNDGGQVLIDVAGSPSAVEDFLRRLSAEAPPASRVRKVRVDPAPAVVAAAGTAVPGGLPSGFHVLPSTGGLTGPSGPSRDIPPDLAVCGPCVTELFEPADRRFRYPFLNCTDCGPRATVIADLPYDRSRTAMVGFPLCPPCAIEYADPGDRRFHAEPVACPTCGPRLSWQQADGATGPVGEAALQVAEAAIAAGAVVAVKGLGGYQLVCDAAAEDTVRRLRGRKHRPSKPFAVMVPDLATATRLAHVEGSEGALLTSVARPIVLLVRRPGRDELAPSVHPGLREVGLFLPTTPLHHLLLADLGRPLVVTSGNLAEEPIRVEDADALRRLAGVAEGFLHHDRPILARYDDSVARVVAGRTMLLRRARGYAPAALTLPIAAPEPVLAVGAELKHTFTLATGSRAVVGPHVGDLEDADSLDAFRGNLDHLARVEGVAPAVVAHDLHPGYLSTQHARGLPGVRLIGVQHHHAHVASCAAEHAVATRFIGVAYDGLGLGEDGTLWGGEVLLADLRGYQRYGRFSRAPLPGGAAAVRHPARTALGYLLGAEDLGGALPPPAAVTELTEAIGEPAASTVRAMLARGINSPLASSAGRCFDAAASLLGLAAGPISYEGEAAVRLEHAADGEGSAALPWRLLRRDGLLVYDAAGTLSALAALRQAGAQPGHLAAGFHQAVIEVTVALVTEAAAETGLDVVCLSGGVWQNRRLTAAVLAALAGQGLTALVNEQVPVNDGGISYGQAAIAAARLARE